MKKISFLFAIMMLGSELSYAQSDLDNNKIDTIAKDVQSIKNTVAGMVDRRSDLEKAKFLGFQFGAGLALTANKSNDRVGAAIIENNTVRVTEESDNQSRILLETHHFREERDKGFLGNKAWAYGSGPFVAIIPDFENTTIDAFGLGWMWGFRKHTLVSEEQEDGSFKSMKMYGNNSWNFGLGFLVEDKVQQLGDGFKANEAPPAGATEVRFKEASDVAFLAMVSFSWR